MNYLNRLFCLGLLSSMGLTGLTFGQSPVLEGKNLIPNGDMEEADGDVPAGWGSTWKAEGAHLTLKRDVTVTKGGNASLQLRIDSAPDALANVTVQIPDLAGGSYIVSGWIRAEPDEPGSLFTGIGQWGAGFAWIERIGDVKEAFEWRRFEKTVTLPKAGKLQVMMRGRGTVWVDDVSVVAVPRDLTPMARTEKSPKVTHVSVVADDLLAVIVVAGEVIPNEHKPYEPLPGDGIDIRPRRTELRRKGQTLGWLVGVEHTFLTTFEGFTGDRLQAALSEEASTYTIQVAGRSFRPVEVWRKSRPIDASNPHWQVVMEHTLLLRLPEKLIKGQTYTINFGELNTLEPSVNFTHSPNVVRSPAVHVNQIGYHPLDIGKQAYLSFWAGRGRIVEYPKGLEFGVIEVESGLEVFRGQVDLAWPANKPEHMQRDLNYNQTDVYRMDFSPLTRPGRYRVVVDGIGCSYPFEIRSDAWVDAFKVAMKGFLHHRSGIALGPPHTDYIRPRGFHPDDKHVTVLETTVSRLENRGDIFKLLVENKTGKEVANAWGSYMDAGDWDRQARHMWFTSLLHMELLELLPSLANFELNLPESGNGLPDLLNEALFGMALFHNTQLANGAILYGVESAEHPRSGEPSWLESQEILAFAPDMLSTHIYAAAAARASRLLQAYNKPLSEEYRRSALAAMAWAESEWPRIQAEIKSGRLVPESRHMHDMPASRSLAALELYHLTGNETWHELFMSVTRLMDPDAALFVWQSHDDRPSAMAYLLMPETLGVPELRDAARRKLLALADDSIAYQKGNAFELSSESRGTPQHLGFYSVPQAMPQVRAHAISGDPKYLESIVRASNFAAGANPTNYVFTTGIGANPVRRPLHVDSMSSGQPSPAGITVYGPFDFVGPMQRSGIFWVGALQRFELQTNPTPRDWPAVELYFDVRRWIAVNEYTVWQTMGPNSYVWGYLAGVTRPTSEVKRGPDGN